MNYVQIDQNEFTSSTLVFIFGILLFIGLIALAMYHIVKIGLKTMNEGDSSAVKYLAQKIVNGVDRTLTRIGMGAFVQQHFKKLFFASCTASLIFCVSLLGVAKLLKEKVTRKTMVMYAVLSRTAPLLCLIFIVSPYIPLFLERNFGVEVMANYAWTLTIVSVLVFAHCVRSWTYWHEQKIDTPSKYYHEVGPIGKVYYHAALTLSSAFAAVIGVGLIMGLLDYDKYTLFILFKNSIVLTAMQTMTVILLGLHFIIPRLSKETANRFIEWYESKNN